MFPFEFAAARSAGLEVFVDEALLGLVERAHNEPGQQVAHLAMRGIQIDDARGHRMSSKRSGSSALRRRRA